MSISKFLITTIILAVAVRSAPQWYQPVQAYYCPVVDGSEAEAGEPWKVGIDVAGGQVLTISESHEESITWTIGGDLGISTQGLSLGGSWSVAETVADGLAEGSDLTCPDGKWRCSAIVTPTMLRVKGHLREENGNDVDAGCDTAPLSSLDHDDLSDGKGFEYLIPIKDDGGNAEVSIDLCTCKNRKNWADPGHPPILCPEDCVEAD